jgi:hypothetical protein
VVGIQVILKKDHLRLGRQTFVAVLVAVSTVLHLVRRLELPMKDATEIHP